jgi:bifunctional UDP-N-acetylglucosamine pyrophosphorylase/glucosamine-1-phosphate N-acetyltransferase
VRLPDPTGYGRIVRAADGGVQRIVEHKDASADERAIDEVYSGIMAVPCPPRRWLARLTKDNAQGEYYLTDIVAMAVPTACPWRPTASTTLQVAGVNSPLQLAELERAHQRAPGRGADGAGRAPGRPGALDLRDDARSVRASWCAGRTWRSTSAASSPAA